MSFGEFYRYVMVGVAIVTFLGGLRYINREKMSPRQALLSSACMVSFAALLYVFDNARGAAKGTLSGFLAFDPGSIWFGSSIVAAGYGLFGYAIIRYWGAERAE